MGLLVFGFIFVLFASTARTVESAISFDDIGLGHGPFNLTQNQNGSHNTWFTPEMNRSAEFNVEQWRAAAHNSIQSMSAMFQNFKNYMSRQFQYSARMSSIGNTDLVNLSKERLNVFSCVATEQQVTFVECELEAFASEPGSFARLVTHKNKTFLEGQLGSKWFDTMARMNHSSCLKAKQFPTLVASDGTSVLPRANETVLNRCQARDKAFGTKTCIAECFMKKLGAVQRTTGGNTLNVATMMNILQKSTLPPQALPAAKSTFRDCMAAYQNTSITEMFSAMDNRKPTPMDSESSPIRKLCTASFKSMICLMKALKDNGCIEKKSEAMTDFGNEGHFTILEDDDEQDESRERIPKASEALSEPDRRGSEENNDESDPEENEEGHHHFGRYSHHKHRDQGRHHRNKSCTTPTSSEGTNIPITPVVVPSNSSSTLPPPSTPISSSNTTTPRTSTPVPAPRANLEMATHDKIRESKQQSGGGNQQEGRRPPPPSGRKQNRPSSGDENEEEDEGYDSQRKTGRRGQGKGQQLPSNDDDYADQEETNTEEVRGHGKQNKKVGTGAGSRTGGNTGNKQNKSSKRPAEQNRNDGQENKESGMASGSSRHGDSMNGATVEQGPPKRNKRSTRGGGRKGGNQGDNPQQKKDKKKAKTDQANREAKE